jgi:Ni,Fe-hydrogenase maturation factor
MAPELINEARAWLVDMSKTRLIKQRVTDTLEEALDIAMERILTEIKDAAAREEWQRLSRGVTR